MQISESIFFLLSGSPRMKAYSESSESERRASIKADLSCSASLIQCGDAWNACIISDDIPAEV